MNQARHFFTLARLISLIYVVQISPVLAYPQPLGNPQSGALGRGPEVPSWKDAGCDDGTKLCVYQISDGQVQAAAPDAVPLPTGLYSAGGWPATSPVIAPISRTAETVTEQVRCTSAIITTSVLSPQQYGTSSVPPDSFSHPTATLENLLTTLTTSAVQMATASPPQSVSGSVITSLETSGAPVSLPFPTSLPTATSSLSLLDLSTLGSVKPTATSVLTTLVAGDIFQAVATDAPPSYIATRSDHPVARLGIQPQQEKLQTNKFYSNLYLNTQTAPVFTFPYSVSWLKGLGNLQSWGLAVSHTEQTQRVTGPARPGIDAGNWEYYTNPLGIQSLVLSAAELGSGTTLTTDTLEAASVNANLLPSAGSPPLITFPLLQGMAFVTGIYSGATPLLQSSVGFMNITYAGTTPRGLTHKYSALLRDGHTWLIYVTPSVPTYPANAFTLMNQTVQGAHDFVGYIQVAKLPVDASGDAQTVYDSSAGVYATGISLSGSVDGTSGRYTMSWAKQGVSGLSLLMFALPHHLTSFNPFTSASLTDIRLPTTVKGIATAVYVDSWLLDEPNLPIDMGFAPWSPALGSVKTVPAEAAAAINEAGAAELSQNVSAQTNAGSLYYDGKALAKFAAIVYALYDIAENHTLALTGLQLLEEAFELHVNNQMTWPLVYDSAWGGVVSSESYNDGNSGDEFGNTYYNDHHFHYGYFVYAAAVIGYLDPTWLQTGSNTEWVNMLVRDYANPVSNDPWFPESRMFDWYHGHSWAEGLFESFDGKNQESSSEDTMASYGLKMWGQITNDRNMEARGNLMLAVQARSLQSYYLYSSNNTVEPADFIGNKAAGILFENKIDHTTFWGAEAEFIEAIHMLPIMPFSTLTRTQQFVQEEWNAYGWSSDIDMVTDGFKGILLANYAIVDPQYSYQVFLNSTGAFSTAFLDGGASQTWYLAWAAALGGAS